jgi:hypothetical protein
LTKPPLHRSRFYSRHYPFYLRAVPSRNKTETPEASILPNGRKSRQPIRLVVEGPKGLRIGLYYCFLPKEFQSASSHPPHIPSASSPTSTSSQIFVQTCLLVFTTPTPLLRRHTFSSQRSIPVQAHALSLHPITNTSTFSFEDPWCT